MKRTILFVSAALSLAAIMAVALIFQDQRPRVEADWTPARFAAELERLDPSWESRPAIGGVLLRRRGGPAWDEGTFVLPPGQMYVEAVPWANHDDTHQPVMMQMHRLVIHGHPDDLRLVAELFSL